MGKRSIYQAIVANPIPEEQQRIKKALEGSGGFQVRYVTHDGLDCLRETVSAQPDLVVLDMVLDKIDGLEVLRRLKEFSLSRTKYLVTSSYTGYLNEQAMLAGASYCALAPYSYEVLAQRARQILTPPQAVFSDREIDRETAYVLLQMGARDSLKGYAFVIEGLRILVRDPGLIRRRRATQELYQVLADAHKIPLYKVERVMRTLTTRIFDDNTPELLLKYFSPATVQRRHVTNTAFLSLVSSLVLERLQASRAQSGSQTVRSSFV